MKYLIQNKAWKINKEYNKEKLLYLLTDRPTIITHVGSFIWKNNKGQVYRKYNLPYCFGNISDKVYFKKRVIKPY